MSDQKWETYSEKFTKEALNNGYFISEINEYLAYAEKLFSQNLPIIYDQIHLSLLIGYKVELLRRITNQQESFYRSFKIPKKTNGWREISEPLPSLKEIQWWILENILSNIQVSKFAKAYIKNRSIKANAFYHINKSRVLTIDIKDFFGSIKYPQVYQVFSNLGYCDEVATMISNLCIYNDCLPQGAPTSPFLSNIIFFPIDKRISAFCLKNEIKYTRYADDMSFSGSFEPGMIIKYVKNVINEKGFKINTKKVRVRKRHQRQEVTGIVVNEKLQAPRELRRRIRQEVYYLLRFGLESHMEYTHNDRANYLRHLLGQVNFVLFVDPNNQEFMAYREKLKELLLD